MSDEELEGLQATLLPDREALSLFNITNIVAINLALAVNAASFGSPAVATAIQGAASTQF
jgi:hypothetical protein